MTESVHVLVDATAIPRDRGGVGRYLEGLLPALAQAGATLSIAVKDSDAEWMYEIVPGARVITPGRVVRSRPLRLLWEQFGLPRTARRASADIVFDPHYTMPLFTRLPRVVTLHDATFFSHPEHHGRLKRVFFRTWTKLSLKRAAVVIAPSEATKRELVKRLGARTDRIVVAPHGVDTSTFHVPDADEVERAADTVGSAHWLAFLGTLEPRKNLRSLVRALPRVLADEATTRRFPGLTLALIGGKGWDTELDPVIEASPARASIRRLGYVPNHELSGLLGGAVAVVYPSIAEGFGLPVIEAMACGAPILTTRALSLPEVGGSVAYYTEPDEHSIASALVSMLNDPELAARREAGVERAAEFTWERSARAHLGAFATAAGS